MRSKVDMLVSVVGVFAKLAMNYPQAVYTICTSCLQASGNVCTDIHRILLIFEALRACNVGRVAPFIFKFWLGGYHQ